MMMDPSATQPKLWPPKSSVLPMTGASHRKLHPYAMIMAPMSNSDKCKVMRLSRRINEVRPAPSYTIHGKSPSVVQNYKYLGIMISSNLKWGDHVKSITSRASRLLGFIRRLVHCSDPKILVNLYTTLYRPILEYGIPAWLPYQIGHIKSLEKIQRCLVRTCIPAPRGELEYSVRLEKLNLMSLCNRYTYLAISFVSKCLYGKCDLDPFEYISLNFRHKIPLNFVTLMPKLRALNTLFLIDFLRILISFL